MAKVTFHRYEPYMGHENRSVKLLTEQISTLREMIKMTENELNNIQSNCNHEYQFSSSGMYEDNYVCKLCGHETEH